MPRPVTATYSVYETRLRPTAQAAARLDYPGCGYAAATALAWRVSPCRAEATPKRMFGLLTGEPFRTQYDAMGQKARALLGG